MIAYILKRCWQALIAVFGALTILFFVQRLTGDPTLLLVPEGATQDVIDSLRTSLGFDKPLYVQYFHSISDLCRFDLVAAAGKIPPARIG